MGLSRDFRASLVRYVTTALPRSSVAGTSALPKFKPGSPVASFRFASLAKKRTYPPSNGLSGFTRTDATS
jgi:hypothetical protein